MSIKITPKQTKVNVTTTPKNRITINTGGGGSALPSNIDTLVELKDVNATNIANTNTVVYDQATGKFVIRELPIVNGGDF
jgi:hypothetical protein